MKIKELKHKRILILGFGREGRDTFRFLRKLCPKKIVGIADRLRFEELVPSAQKIIKADNYSRPCLGKNYLEVLKNYDVIIKSPGIPFKVIPRSELRKLTSSTEIFFENCQGQIVGITGTKGKGTTAVMIYEILKAAAIKARLIGNIGQPVLNLLPISARPDNVYVYELSSHQLYHLKKSPRIAVFLNLFADHLDYYRNFEEYVRAKANIALHQKKDDYLVYNVQDKIVREIANKSKAKKVPIKGEHYELNKAAARAVAKLFKIPSKIIEKTIKEFKHLPHRLELVGTFKRITFYNDALATIPEATIAALETLGSKVETIILGGSEKNLDFKKLAKKILESKIKTVILFPTTGQRIWKDIVRQKKRATNKEGRVLNHFFVNKPKSTWPSPSSPSRAIAKGEEEDSSSSPFSAAQYMKEAVKLAYQHTPANKICLLSTACASFSIFKDYKEKGDLFKKYVKKLAHGKN